MARRFLTLLTTISGALLLSLSWGKLAAAPGPALAQTETGIVVPVDAGAAGIPIERDLLGQFIPNPRVPAFDPESRQGAAAVVATHLRGLYGAFYAEYYDWRDPLGLNDPLRPGPVEGIPEIRNQLGTLDYLRLAAANGASVSLNVNTRGVREDFSHPQASSLKWVMTDTATLAEWAADWVLYTNYTVHHFHVLNPPHPGSSDALERRSAEILEAIEWRNRDGSNRRPELPEAGERLPLVTHWEIGNEPNYPLSGFRLRPAEFAERYLAITAAMIERDLLINGERTIKVGPSLTATYPPDPFTIQDYMDALAAVGAVVDFVAYHPYTKLFGPWEYRDGVIEGSFTPSDAADFTADDLAFVRTVLSGLYSFQRTLYVSTTLASPPGVEVFASEWHPSSWEATFYDEWKAQSMGNALGVLETVFTFARLGLDGAVFFSDPAFRPEDRPHPLYETFKFLERSLGEELLAVHDGGSPRETGFRAYATRHGAGSEMPGAIVLWGLNWGAEGVRFDFELSGLGPAYRVGQRCVLAGESLLHGSFTAEGAPPLEAPLELACGYAGGGAASSGGGMEVAMEVPPSGWVAVVLWPYVPPVRVGLGGWGGWNTDFTDYTDFHGSFWVLLLASGGFWRLKPGLAVEENKKNPCKSVASVKSVFYSRCR